MAESREEKRWIERRLKASRRKLKKEENARMLRLIDNAHASDPRLKRLVVKKIRLKNEKKKGKGKGKKKKKRYLILYLFSFFLFSQVQRGGEKGKGG